MGQLDTSERWFFLNKIQGVEISDINNTSNLDAEAPAHSIRLLRTPTIGTAVVDGETVLKEKKGSGFVWFIPASAHVFFDTTQHNATNFSIDQSAIDEVVGYRANITNWKTHFGTTVSHLAQSLREIAMEDKPCPVVTESVRLAFVAAVVRDVDPVAKLRFEGGLQRRSHQRVVDYIEDNIGKSVTLQDLAEVAGMSKFAFLRAWSKATGMTPMQDLYRRRVQHAKRMLSRSDMPIAHIALACGFSSQSHMTNVFKTITGSTPAAYRRSFSL